MAFASSSRSRERQCRSPQVAVQKERAKLGEPVPLQQLQLGKETAHCSGRSGGAVDLPSHRRVRLQGQRCHHCLLMHRPFPRLRFDSSCDSATLGSNGKSGGWIRKEDSSQVACAWGQDNSIWCTVSSSRPHIWQDLYSPATGVLIPEIVHIP